MDITEFMTKLVIERPKQEVRENKGGVWTPLGEREIVLSTDLQQKKNNSY